MNKICALLTAFAWLALDADSLVAADRVKVVQGNQSTGEIIESTPTELFIQVGSVKKKIPVNDIELVTFDGEPNDLSQARIAVRGGRFEDALALLDKIDLKAISRREIAEDVEYYRAFAAAKLALAGTGSKADAGRKLLNFEKAHKLTFHYYEACETLGDLFAALDKFEQAESFYEKLDGAPWPDYKMRAGVLAGRALVSSKHYDRAATKFDEVLAVEASGKEADRLKLAASLGKAAALAGAGKSDQAVDLVDQIIVKADPENLELQARAYNLLGNCYKTANKKKEALLAFLHVDLLYSRFPEQHAEALANLATLWAELDKADRAAQARATLKEKYPTSVWATQ